MATYSTWEYWGYHQTCSTYTSASTSTNATWSNWCAGSTTTAASNNDMTWITWNTPTTGGYETYRVAPAPVKTPEELALEAIENDRYWAEMEASRKLLEEKRKAADERALQLLLENLEENQKEVFEKTGAIPVTGQSGTKYLIRKGTARNIEQLDGERVTRRLCFHPRDYVPIYDSMLTQKLMLELHEQYARGVANYS